MHKHLNSSMMHRLFIFHLFNYSLFKCGYSHVQNNRGKSYKEIISIFFIYTFGYYRVTPCGIRHQRCINCSPEQSLYHKSATYHGPTSPQSDVCIQLALSVLVIGPRVSDSRSPARTPCGGRALPCPGVRRKENDTGPRDKKWTARNQTQNLIYSISLTL
jgi:hypothetical protein